MAGSSANVMSVVSVSDPRLASKVGTRTWGTGRVPLDADELTAAAFEPIGSRKLEAARDFLRTRLASSSALSKTVEREAVELGISPRT
jgi:hypothetical protein